MKKRVYRCVSCDKIVKSKEHLSHSGLCYKCAKHIMVRNFKTMWAMKLDLAKQRKKEGKK